MVRMSESEKLEAIANAATAAGMTYGQYQHRRMNIIPDKSGMREKQPVYMPERGEYVCPSCAHPVKPHTNCGHCGKQLIWKSERSRQ